MKRGPAVLYTVVTVVFFLAVAAVLLFRLGAVRETNLTTARASFRDLQEEIVAVAEETRVPTSQLVQAAFRARTAPDGRVMAFAAYGVQDDIEYLWARSRRVLDQTSEETPRFTYDRVTQARLSGSVRLPDGSPLVLEGIYTVLDGRDIFTLLRDSLIAVLAFALLAVILAVITLLRPVRGTRSPVDEQSRGRTPHRSAPSEPAEAAAPSRPSSPSARRSAPGPTVPASSGGDGIDTGLFSPQSGLGPESHLEKRLSLELERAAANDQDLSICFIEYPKLSRGGEDYRETATALAEFFGFEDLIFEYGTRSFCVLFPNVDLQEAIQRAEEFQRRGLEKPADGDGGARAPRAAGQPAFGLSSRNGRLVEGGRLMREARQALSKAQKTPGRVMGFRPDPQRYRRYISETEA